jgi:hypothetical protein
VPPYLRHSPSVKPGGPAPLEAGRQHARTAARLVAHLAIAANAREVRPARSAPSLHKPPLARGQPGPLTIAGGVVRWPGTVPTAGGTAEGRKCARRAGHARPIRGVRFEEQIDGRGTVAGRVTSYCGYQLVWQKEGK